MAISCTPCNYAAFYERVRTILTPALLGHGLPGYPNPTSQIAWVNHVPEFTNDMWDGYNNFGCQWFCGRVSHWCGEIDDIAAAGAANPPLDYYTLYRKFAKIQWAQTMHLCCGCNMQLNPNVTPPGPFVYPTCASC